ncbi:MAG: calcium-binding protein, partial [Octadecabacter sp.]
GSSTVTSNDFFVGNADFFPEYYDGTFGENPALDIPAGASIVLVPAFPGFSSEVFVPPVPVTQAEFEAVYGPLPDGAIFLSYVAYFGPSDVLDSGLSYTIGAYDEIGETVAVGSDYIPGGAAEGQSVLISPEDGSSSIGTPTPGSTGVVAPITSTEGNDTLVGTAGADTIDGLGGNDVIDGGTGDDDIYGGKGADNIQGGDGADYIDGGRQSDVIFGGDQSDEIYGGTGNDSIYGDDGADLLFGGSGNDYFNGGKDDDVIYGDHGKDTVLGGSGEDTLFGGASNDQLNGNSGDDALYGGTGSDKLYGGGNDDVLDGGSQSDQLFGGAGSDTLHGGLGHDELTGGADSDTFVFAGTVNNDIITDFEVGVDQIDLTGYGPISTADAIAIASQSGTDVVLDLGQNGSVTLQGIDLGDLSLDDFVYIPDDIFVVG